MHKSEIISSLKGQSFVLPDWDTIDSDWPVVTSRHLTTLREYVNDRVETLLSQPSSFRYPNPARKAKEIKAADFGYMVCQWWPRASVEVLKVLACYMIWTFIWDDEVDSDHGSLGSDVEGSKHYRAITLQYMLEELSLIPKPERSEPLTTNFLITSFDVIINAVSHTPRKQRERLYTEVEYWINTTEIEQQRRNTESEMRPFNEYMPLRMGTCGYRPCAILYDILTGSCFDSIAPTCSVPVSYTPVSISPSQSLNDVDKAMETMVVQTTLIIGITNDIFSARKEIADGAPDNSIPSLWLASRNLTTAMNTAVDILKTAIAEFEAAERQVKESSAANSLETIRLLAFIESLKTNVTGHEEWSMRCRRYGLQDRVGEKGIVITL